MDLSFCGKLLEKSILRLSPGKLLCWLKWVEWPEFHWVAAYGFLSFHCGGRFLLSFMSTLARWNCTFQLFLQTRIVCQPSFLSPSVLDVTSSIYFVPCRLQVSCGIGFQLHKCSCAPSLRKCELLVGFPLFLWFIITLTGNVGKVRSSKEAAFSLELWKMMFLCK